MFLKTKFKTRLIFSVLMLGATALTLTTSTFAWFANNKEAWIDDFEIELKNVDNLSISVDGINYRNSIPNDMLKKAIIAKKLNYEYSDERLTETFVRDTYSKIGLDSVTTKNLVDFKNIDKFSIDENTNTYNLTDADLYGYVTFDLWFRVASSNSQTKKYDLKFVSNEYAEKNKTANPYVESVENTVFLYNELYTTGALDERTGTRATGPYKGIAYQKGQYLAGDSIISNPADAIRIGVIHSDEKTTTIYEPRIGLGSYAIEDYINTNIDGMDIYDPNKNAMYTYFNNINEASIKPIDSDQKIYLDTEKDFNGDVSFGQFENLGTGYDDIKVTVAIWIEAYDADYIVGLQNGSVKIMLNFCIEEAND